MRRARLPRGGTRTRRRRLTTGSSTAPTVLVSGVRATIAIGVRTSRPRPIKRARSVSNWISPTTLAFDDGKMRDPDLGLAGRARPPRRQDGADIGDEFRFDE